MSGEYLLEGELVDAPKLVAVLEGDELEAPKFALDEERPAPRVPEPSVLLNGLAAVLLSGEEALFDSS